MPTNAARDRRDAANGAHDGHRVGRLVEHREHAGDEVDTGGDHRGGVHQGADRRRAFHGVRQPHLERHLGALAGGAGEEAEREQRQRRAAEAPAMASCWIVVNIERTRLGVDEEDRQQEAEVAQARDEEGLLGGSSRGGTVEPEADEQVGRDTDHLPEHVHHEEAVHEDQPEHGSREQGHVGEVAPVTRIAVHVALGVDLDQERNGGDDDEHDGREAVNVEPDVDRDVADAQPLSAREGQAMAVSLQRAIEHPEGEHEGDADAGSGDVPRVLLHRTRHEQDRAKRDHGQEEYCPDGRLGNFTEQAKSSS